MNKFRQLERNYMLKSTTNNCVKYVNNHRIIDSKTSAILSTTPTYLINRATIYVFKTNFYQFHLPPISTIISTYINAIYNLLKKSFTHYPQYLLLEPLKEN